MKKTHRFIVEIPTGAGTVPAKQARTILKNAIKRAALSEGSLIELTQVKVAPLKEVDLRAVYDGVEDILYHHADQEVSSMVRDYFRSLGVPLS